MWMLLSVRTREEVKSTLQCVTDPERLPDIGYRPVRCDTGEEFLARVGSSPVGMEAHID